MEDNKIVDLYWMRNENAISETAAKYGKYCYAIAYNILGHAEDAKESVNDTYLGAWNAMPPHRPTVLRTFLGKIARRVSLKRWRDGSREKRGGGEVALALDELSECVPSKASVEEEIIAAELAETLNRFVSGLPDTERQVFICRYWYLDSIKDIAKRHGVSQGCIKTNLCRNRKKLYRILKREVLI